MSASPDLRYRALPGGRRVVRLMFAFFALIVALLVLAVALGAGSFEVPLLFLAFWFCGLAWNFYWMGFRVAVELHLLDAHLESRSAFQTRSVPLADVVEVRPARMAPNGAVIELRDQRSVSKGFAGFVAALEAERPLLPIRLSRFTRLSEVLPGRSGLKRR